MVWRERGREREKFGAGNLRCARHEFARDSWRTVVRGERESEKGNKASDNCALLHGESERIGYCVHLQSRKRGIVFAGLTRDSDGKRGCERERARVSVESK